MFAQKKKLLQCAWRLPVERWRGTEKVRKPVKGIGRALCIMLGSLQSPDSGSHWRFFISRVVWSDRFLFGKMILETGGVCKGWGRGRQSDPLDVGSGHSVQNTDSGPPHIAGLGISSQNRICFPRPCQDPWISLPSGPYFSGSSDLLCFLHQVMRWVFTSEWPQEPLSLALPPAALA